MSDQIHDHPLPLELELITLYHGLYYDKRTAWCRNRNRGKEMIGIEISTPDYVPDHQPDWKPLRGVRDMREDKTSFNIGWLT